MAKYPWPKTKDGHYEDASLPRLDSPQPTTEYPKRFYAQMFEKEGQKLYGRGRIKGWIDAWSIYPSDALAPVADLLPMTVEQWAYKNSTDEHYVSVHLSAVYRDGEFWDYNPLEDDEINQNK